MTGNYQDRLIKPGKLYDLKILGRQIPLYQKLKVEKWFPLKIFYKKLFQDFEPEPSHEEDGIKRIKGDLIIYISMYSRHPGPDDHDFMMRGKEMFLTLKKEYPYLNGHIIYLAFYSNSGAHVYFQYLFEKDLPSSEIVQPN